MTLCVEGLSVRYGARAVIEDFSMTVPPGELTAIVGPNGSGKSTLIKAICGDLTCDGLAMLNGTNVAQARA